MVRLEENVDNLFFDIAFRVLNYAIEFVNDLNYSSLRFIDVLRALLKIQKLIGESSRDGFYDRLRKKLDSRGAMSLTSLSERSKFLDELLDMFIEEWRIEEH